MIQHSTVADCYAGQRYRVNMYSVFILYSARHSAQTWITQFYLQFTPCLSFLRKRSPDDAIPN